MTATSQAVSLDDMLIGQNDILLSRNLLDDIDNEAGLISNTPLITNDLFPPLDRNNIYNYTNQRRPFWSIPEIIDVNPLGISDNDIYTDTYLETSFTPQVMVTGDCCICFTESTQCFTLEHCNHTVCSSCYTGVYTRVNGDVDLRCPMCHIPHSFNSNVYRQILGIDI